MDVAFRRGESSSTAAAATSGRFPAAAGGFPTASSVASSGGGGPVIDADRTPTRTDADDEPAITIATWADERALLFTGGAAPSGKPGVAGEEGSVWPCEETGSPSSPLAPLVAVCLMTILKESELVNVYVDGPVVTARYKGSVVSNHILARKITTGKVGDLTGKNSQHIAWPFPKWINNNKRENPTLTLFHSVVS
jgi:hypothetical protein